MGKLTFRRVVTTLKRNLVIASLPIAGGTLFLLGSFCFWPHSSRFTINVGALCFLVGSSCYWAAPFLDFWELTHNYGNLLEPPPNANKVLASEDAHHMAALYEHLYKAHLLRIQCANCLVYMLGGGFFVGGSTLFFPAMEEIIYHGGWLYITGCVLTLSGALLAMFTAFEMRKTATPMRFARPPSCLVLPFWADETATIVSCSLYVAGNAVFIIGSICFFPRIIAAFGIAIEYIAVILFIVGSVLFTAGSIIDIIVLGRGSLLVREEVSLRVLSIRQRQSQKRRSRKYLQMRDSIDEGTPPTARGVELTSTAAPSSARESVVEPTSARRSFVEDAAAELPDEPPSPAVTGTLVQERESAAVDSPTPLSPTADACSPAVAPEGVLERTRPHDIEEGAPVAAVTGSEAADTRQVA